MDRSSEAVCATETSIVAVAVVVLSEVGVGKLRVKGTVVRCSSMGGKTGIGPLRLGRTVRKRVWTESVAAAARILTMMRGLSDDGRMGMAEGTWHQRALGPHGICGKTSIGPDAVVRDERRRGHGRRSVKDSRGDLENGKVRKASVDGKRGGGGKRV